MISASVDELRSAIGVLELPPPPSVVSFEKKNEKWGQTDYEVVFFVNVLSRYFHFGPILKKMCEINVPPLFCLK